MDLQAMMDGMSARWQRERANTQMTLGKFIEVLTAMPKGAVVKGLGDLISYRGYYSDLAFKPTDTEEPAEALLARCRAAMGQVFKGYKGGDYVMGALTPLWISGYRDVSGTKIIGIAPDGKIETAQDE